MSRVFQRTSETNMASNSVQAKGNLDLDPDLSVDQCCLRECLNKTSKLLKPGDARVNVRAFEVRIYHVSILIQLDVRCFM